MDDRLYWLWLAGGLGFAARQLRPLLESYTDAAGVFAHRGELLVKRLVTPAQFRALKNSRPQDFERVLEQHLAAGYQVLALDDPDYPELLREIDDPPAVLYVEGNLSVFQHALPISMIGTRRPSAYGIEAARMIAGQLVAAGALLISGLADGLDSEAHKAAVAVGAPTVAVLGTAIDRTYPARNQTLREMILHDGAVISEYPIGTEGQKSFFVLRNRIIAGLCRGLLVVEARQRSGTMSTVQFALENGRDVFAVPGSIFSPVSAGTNRLLQQGAKAVMTADDILCEYGYEMCSEPAQLPGDAPKDEPALSEQAQAVYRLLTARPQGLEALCAASGLPSGVVMAALTELELAGLSRQLAGRQFERCG